MADGSIIIDSRINNKGAEADLKALQAKAKSTAQQIAAVDKQLGSAQTKRSTLVDSLEAARQKAAETADALEKVNARLDAGHNSKYGVTSAADEALSNKLAAQLEQQDAKVREIEGAYRAQETAVQGLQQQHTALTAQLEREQQAVQGQQTEIADTDRVRQAAAAVGDFAARIAKAVAQANVLKKVLGTAGAIGQKVFSAVGSRVQAIRSRLDQPCDRRAGIQRAFVRPAHPDRLDGHGAAVVVQPAGGAGQFAGRGCHSGGSPAVGAGACPDGAGERGGDGVQLHRTAGGVLHGQDHLGVCRGGQGHERRRQGRRRRSEEGQGRQRRVGCL